VKGKPIRPSIWPWRWPNAAVPFLLVDCDLRRPCISRLLDVPNQRGMSTYLTGNNKIEEVIQQYKPQPNLS